MSSSSGYDKLVETIKKVTGDMGMSPEQVDKIMARGKQELMVRPPGRLSRPQLFMAVSRLYGQRSSCPRAEVGVTAIRDGRIVAAGYCGAPAGQPHCLEVGCDIVDDHCVRSVHAEANMVAWAARTGMSLEGCEVYCTHYPCLNCANLVANAGIRRFTFEKSYHNNDNRVLNVLSIFDFKYAT